MNKGQDFFSPELFPGGFDIDLKIAILWQSIPQTPAARPPARRPAAEESSGHSPPDVVTSGANLCCLYRGVFRRDWEYKSRTLFYGHIVTATQRMRFYWARKSKSPPEKLHGLAVSGIGYECQLTFNQERKLAGLTFIAIQLSIRASVPLPPSVHLSISF